MINRSIISYIKITAVLPEYPAFVKGKDTGWEQLFYEKGNNRNETAFLLVKLLYDERSW
jgi:hypothetical protein